MSETTDSKKEFSVIRRARSFKHASRGIAVFIKTTHNAWIHIFILIVAIIFGFYIGISETEWMSLVFAAGLVLTAEAFNSAIEIDIDLTSPEYHPYARDTKDIAAGAVLISAITAIIIGILIFGHYII